MMDQSEPKHVGENIMYNNMMYIRCLRSVFSLDLIESKAMNMEDAKC
jgi:hypothetical protein